LKLQNTEYQSRYDELQAEQTTLFEEKQVEIRNLITAIDSKNENEIETAQQSVKSLLRKDRDLRTEARTLIEEADPLAKTEDTDYVFITFVTRHLPIGLIGLLLAVIFSAAMSSTSSELNALATTSVVDLYRRLIVKDASDHHYLNASKWLTVIWGAVALGFAMTASLFDNLIEAVNIVGSVFYGAILGIFLVAFFLRRVNNKSRFIGMFTGAIIGTIIVSLITTKLHYYEILVGGIPGAAAGLYFIQHYFKSVGSNSVFIAALIAEVFVITIFILDRYEFVEIAYLWLNLIGCVLVVFFSLLLQVFLKHDIVKPDIANVHY
jgi:Na+/proline symporter